MKKHFKKTLLFMLVLIMALIPLKAEAASQKTKALKAYNKMLAKKTIRWGTDSSYPSIPTKNCKFAVAYIDNDSIPELIVYNAKDVPHMVGYGMVYTYKNGKVKAVENVNIDAKFYYYSKKGVFVTSYCQGGVTYTYFKLSKGKAAEKLQQGKPVYPPNAPYYYYKISKDKRSQITKKSFTKALNNMVGKKKKTTAKFYKNTSGNRKKYLK